MLRVKAPKDLVRVALVPLKVNLMRMLTPLFTRTQEVSVLPLVPWVVKWETPTPLFTTRTTLASLEEIALLFTGPLSRVLMLVGLAAVIILVIPEVKLANPVPELMKLAL